jgi:thiaminase/transcriptional activator TenA
MRLHIGICAEEGISQAELEATQEAAANLAYTRYVLDAGHSGDLLDLLAALAPCVMGYGEIGARLLGGLGETGAGDTPYRDWIETYGGAEYQQVCHCVGELIDSAVARRIGPDPQAAPRWNRLCERFTMATTLEVGFWDMGQTYQADT